MSKNYKYLKKNQWWAIKSPDDDGSFIFPHTITSDRSLAISKYIENKIRVIHPTAWKQAYDKGYRAVRINITEISEFG